MLEKEAFLKAYEDVEVPVPMHLKRDQDPEFIAARDALFTRVKASLDLSYLVLSETVTIKADVVPSRSGPRSLLLFEDLWFADEQVLASALQRVGPGAQRSARFAKYPLTPSTVQSIQNYREAEGLLF